MELGLDAKVGRRALLDRRSLLGERVNYALLTERRWTRVEGGWSVLPLGDWNFTLGRVFVAPLVVVVRGQLLGVEGHPDPAATRVVVLAVRVYYGPQSGRGVRSRSLGHLFLEMMLLRLRLVRSLLVLLDGRDGRHRLVVNHSRLVLAVLLFLFVLHVEDLDGFLLLGRWRGRRRRSRKRLVRLLDDDLDYRLRLGRVVIVVVGWTLLVVAERGVDLGVQQRIVERVALGVVGYGLHLDRVGRWTMSVADATVRLPLVPRVVLGGCDRRGQAQKNNSLEDEKLSDL